MSGDISDNSRRMLEISKMLPDDPSRAVGIIMATAAVVAVSQGCDDEQAHTALHQALQKVHEGSKDEGVH